MKHMVKLGILVLLTRCFSTTLPLRKITHNGFVKLEIVGLVKDHVVEIIQQCFPLKHELMEGIEGLESEHGLRPTKYSREPMGT